MSTSQTAPSASSEARIKALKEEIASLESKLAGEDPGEIHARHIKILHRYNEVKDTTQNLISKYAVLQRTTVTAVHEGYGLPLKD